jgi:hypothetical protein
VTLNIIIGNITVGQGYLQNVVLSPGNNTVPIRAVVNIKTLIQNFGAIFAAEAGALSNGNLIVSASGNSTVYEGQHIPYYETVLRDIVLTGEVSLGQLLVGTVQQFLGGNSASSLIAGLLGAGGGRLNLTQIVTSLRG